MSEPRPDGAMESFPELNPIPGPDSPAYWLARFNAEVGSNPSQEDLEAFGFTSEEIESLGLFKWVWPTLPPDTIGMLVKQLVFRRSEAERALKDPAVNRVLQKRRVERMRQTDPAANANEVKALSLVIEVEKVGIHKLELTAAHKWRERHRRAIEAGTKPAYAELDEWTKARLMIQVVRHDHSNYDQAWRQFHDQPGAEACFEVIRAKTAEAIKKAYPDSLAMWVNAAMVDSITP
ncbi:hypothetical protein [uncultured Citricoccus sp.]|uniref:hypothetical protein n=1 Tax=uncultured Citricoccus sp. TaxID=614031 RepID=UPI00262913E3|nr:hypothetical protein [uncultured Citricoccus sp.]